jgi:putative sterol carrier protein
MVAEDTTTLCHVTWFGVALAAMATSDLDTGAVDAAQFARSVATTTDDQLAAGVRSEFRGQILDEIFGRMEEHFHADRATGVDAVVHFRITDRPDGGEDRYEVVLRDGTCALNNPPQHDARTTIVVDPVSFLKLVTGNANGPELFLRRKLKIKGDLVFAAQVAGLFRIPRG